MWKDPTDVTNRKPRRLRGTPARKAVLLLSGGITLLSGLIGCYQFFGPMGREISQDIENKVYDYSDEEFERRLKVRNPLIFNKPFPTSEVAVDQVTGDRHV